jgi:hypothetical protein
MRIGAFSFGLPSRMANGKSRTHYEFRIVNCMAADPLSSNHIIRWGMGTKGSTSIPFVFNW